MKTSTQLLASNKYRNAHSPQCVCSREHAAHLDLGQANMYVNLYLHTEAYEEFHSCY